MVILKMRNWASKDCNGGANKVKTNMGPDRQKGSDMARKVTDYRNTMLRNSRKKVAKYIGNKVLPGWAAE